MSLNRRNRLTHSEKRLPLEGKASLRRFDTLLLRPTVHPLSHRWRQLPLHRGAIRLAGIVSNDYSVGFVGDGFQPFAGAALAGDLHGHVTEPAVLLGAVPMLPPGGDGHNGARDQTSPKSTSSFHSANFGANSPRASRPAVCFPITNILLIFCGP